MKPRWPASPGHGSSDDYLAWLIDALKQKLLMTGNPLYAWMGYQAIRHGGLDLPEWLTGYFDRVASNIETLTRDPELSDPAIAIARALEMLPMGPSVFRLEREDTTRFRYIVAVHAHLSQGDKLDFAYANAASDLGVSKGTVQRAWRNWRKVSRETVNPKT
jgi:hypothetical protein